MPIEDRLKVVVLAKATSTTGKYQIFLGQHYNGRHYCYDVGSLNRQTGEIVRRHYTRQEEAYSCWNEFRDRMTAPRGPSEEEEKDAYTIIKPN